MRFPAGFKEKSAPSCKIRLKQASSITLSAARSRIPPLSECQQRRNHDLLKKLSRD
jgi:hypothetical protein